MRIDDSESQKHAFQRYLKHSQVGVQFFVAVGLFTGCGIWLDRQLGTKVLFTLLGLAVGFAGGFRAVYLDLYGKGKGGSEKSPSEDRPGRCAGGEGKDGDGDSPARR